MLVLCVGIVWCREFVAIAKIMCSAVCRFLKKQKVVMPKYYVKSGTLKSVTMADTPLKAMVNTLTNVMRRGKGFSLGIIFEANEYGFVPPCKECDKQKCDICPHADGENCTADECEFCLACEHLFYVIEASHYTTLAVIEACPKDIRDNFDVEGMREEMDIFLNDCQEEDEEEEL